MSATSYKPLPVCPYCGNIERNAWEIDFHHSDYTDHCCGICGEEYNLTRHVSVCYSTKKKGGAA